MDLARQVCKLANNPNADMAHYVIVRDRDRDDYERDGFTFIGQIDNARSLTGKAPMILMQRPAPPPPKPAPAAKAPTKASNRGDPAGGLGWFKPKR